MNFGQAIEELKAGRKCWRQGWNGKGMFLILVAGTDNAPLKETPPYQLALHQWHQRYESPLQTTVTINPHIDMYTATGEMQPGWLASQTDMLSDDWQSERY